MKKLLLAGLASIFLFTAAACGSTAAQTEAATTVKQEVKQTIDAFGTIKTTKAKNIVIDFTASVDNVAVKDGQKVKLGDVLVNLNVTDYQSQIKNKELELASVNRDILRLSPEKSSDPDIKKLGSDIKSAEVLYNKAVTELAAKDELLKSGSISQYDYDEFQKSVEAKKKALEDSKFALESTKATKRKELDAALVRADALNADLQAMKDKLNRSYIKGNQIISDVSRGVVSDIGYISGDILSPAKSLLSIIDLDQLVAEASVNEEFIKDVKMGAAATISPLADKTKSYKGKVTYISDKAVTMNGETTVAVQITLDKPDDFLLPAFNIEVKIDK